MSKRKPKQILGPDGKPYVASPKPQPRAEPAGGPRTFEATFTSDNVDISYAIGRLFDFGGKGNVLPASAPKIGFREAVAEQIEALTSSFDGHGEAELPAAPRDLTAYRDAYASAAAKCKHEDAVELLYGRQWVCDACGRTLNRDDMRRAGWSRFGW